MYVLTALSPDALELSSLLGTNIRGAIPSQHVVYLTNHLKISIIHKKKLKALNNKSRHRVSYNINLIEARHLSKH